MISNSSEENNKLDAMFNASLDLYDKATMLALF